MAAACRPAGHALILENFEFPYELVFPPDLDKGGLRAKDRRDCVQRRGRTGRRWWRWTRR